MKSLLDDCPDRSIFVNPAQTRPVVLVSGSMFLRRGKDINECLPEVSESVFSAFLSKYKGSAIIVFVPARVRDVLIPLLFPRATKGEIYILDDFNDTENGGLRVFQTQMKNMLADLGVRLNPGADRGVHPYNVGQYVMSGNLTVYGFNEFTAAGVEPDKAETIEDMMTKRRQKSWL